MAAPGVRRKSRTKPTDPARRRAGVYDMFAGALRKPAVNVRLAFPHSKAERVAGCRRGGGSNRLYQWPHRLGKLAMPAVKPLSQDHGRLASRGSGRYDKMQYKWRYAQAAEYSGPESRWSAVIVLHLWRRIEGAVKAG